MPRSILMVFLVSVSAADASADAATFTSHRTGAGVLERSTSSRPVTKETTAREGPASLAEQASRLVVRSRATLHARDAAESSAQPGRARGFVARHPVLVGAIVGAVVGGSGAFAKWGSEGTWVGVWIGAGIGGGIGALASR